MRIRGRGDLGSWFAWSTEFIREPVDPSPWFRDLTLWCTSPHPEGGPVDLTPWFTWSTSESADLTPWFTSLHPDFPEGTWVRNP